MCPTASDGLWTTEIKKGLPALGTRLGSRVSKTCLCVTEASVDVQAATVHPYSATLAQLITSGHGYRGDTTRQDGTTMQAMFSAVEQ
jgi:hypothetical protein